MARKSDQNMFTLCFWVGAAAIYRGLIKLEPCHIRFKNFRFALSVLPFMNRLCPCRLKQGHQRPDRLPAATTSYRLFDSVKRKPSGLSIIVQSRRFHCGIGCC